MPFVACFMIVEKTIRHYTTSFLEKISQIAAKTHFFIQGFAFIIHN